MKKTKRVLITKKGFHNHINVFHKDLLDYARCKEEFYIDYLVTCEILKCGILEPYKIRSKQIDEYVEEDILLIRFPEKHYPAVASAKFWDTIHNLDYNVYAITSDLKALCFVNWDSAVLEKYVDDGTKGEWQRGELKNHFGQTIVDVEKQLSF